MRSGSRIGRRFVLATLVAMTIVAGCTGGAAYGCGSSGSTACTRVLFLGNSYTFVNDLPGTFGRLAASAGKNVETGFVAHGGETLDDHDRSAESARALDGSTWAYVVLQEQSEIPAIGASRVASMYPAGRSLVGKTRSRGATPLLFLTWAHRDGYPAGGLGAYAAMERELERGYLDLAAELDVPVAPVGPAWSSVRASAPDVALWQDDGSHPSTAGTYLAACVFYAAIFRERPVGLTYLDGLSADTARRLQEAAGWVVLSDPARWRLR